MSKYINCQDTAEFECCPTCHENELSPCCRAVARLVDDMSEGRGMGAVVNGEWSEEARCKWPPGARLG